MMSRYLLSTVRRNCPPDQPSGYIYVVDPVAQRVVQRSAILEPLFRELDKNPRGGMRGGKGISLDVDQAALANFSMIFRYDPTWKLLGTITHPSLAGIHDILLDSDGIWAAAARLDMLVRFNHTGSLDRHVYLRAPSSAIRELGWNAPVLLNDEIIRKGMIDFRDPREVEKETYDRAHVNSLCRLHDGDLLASLGFVYDEKYARFLRLKIRLIQWGVWPVLKAGNRWARRALGRKQKNMDQNLVVKPAQAKSALVRITPGGERRLCLVLNNMTAPSHSLLTLPDGTVIYLNTTAGCILNIDPDSGRLLSNTLVSEKGFLRGVTRMQDGSLLVGSRGELISFDLSGCHVTQRFAISSDPNEAIYDIKELPEHYQLPPASFAEDFTRQTGLSSAEALIRH